ncbi:MAG: hypothetical protein QXM43_03525 [Desulfurococcaceae archaeon]
MPARILLNVFRRWFKRHVTMRFMEYAVNDALAYSRPPKWFEDIVRCLHERIDL